MIRGMAYASINDNQKTSDLILFHIYFIEGARLNK